MKRNSLVAFVIFLVVCLASPLALSAQGRPADYERADGLREKFQALALDVPGRVAWIEKTHRFWYRKTVKDGFEFELVDADTLAKKPAFDHEKLAAALNAASGQKYTGGEAPVHDASASRTARRPSSSRRRIFAGSATSRPTP